MFPLDNSWHPAEKAARNLATSAALAGGFFNLELSGSGWVALLSDGPPLATGPAEGNRS